MYSLGKKGKCGYDEDAIGEHFYDSVRKAISDIEARYDVGDKKSFALAVEGTSNMAHLYKMLCFVRKGGALDKMSFEPMGVSSLLHYSGKSPAIKKLVGEYGGYFQNIISNKPVANQDHISEMDYFMQLRVKRLENMGIDPSIIINPH